MKQIDMNNDDSYENTLQVFLSNNNNKNNNSKWIALEAMFHLILLQTRYISLHQNNITFIEIEEFYKLFFIFKINKILPIFVL